MFIPIGNGEPIIDLRFALEQTMQDKEFLLELLVDLRDYLEETDPKIREMRKESDFKELKQQLHFTKGTSSFLLDHLA